MNKTYGYARVSTREQNLDRQVLELAEYVVDERDIITDKASGKDFNRGGYVTLRNTLLREGDTLVIKELDRLGRDMNQIKEEWNYLLKMGVDIVVLDTPMLNTKGKDTLEKTLISNIVFELLSYMAQKEREKIKQRQAEGISAAKSKGKRLGRPVKAVGSAFEGAYREWKAGRIMAVEAMEMSGLTKATFYRRVKELDATH